MPIDGIPSSQRHEERGAADAPAGVNLLQKPTETTVETSSCAKLTADIRKSLKPPLHTLISVFVLLGILLILFVCFLISITKFRSSPNIAARSPKLLVASAILTVVAMLTVTVSVMVGSEWRLQVSCMLWTQSFALPLLMLIQLLRMIRFGRLRESHKLKLELSKETPVHSGAAGGEAGDTSNAMYHTRDRLLECEEQLALLRPHTREKRMFVMLSVAGAVLLGLACVWQFGISLCSVFESSMLGLLIWSALPLLIWLLQVGQLVRLRSIRDAFFLKLEFGVVTSVNAAYLLSQAPLALLLSNKQPPLILLIEAHATATALLLVLVASVQLACLMMAMRKGKVGYVQSFDDFVLDPVSREFFSEFMEMEMNSAWVLFWQDALAYKMMLSSHGEKACPHDIQAMHECVARNIYSKYVRAGAMMDVRLDMPLRQEVAFRINTSKIGITVFDAAIDSVSERLQTAYVRFLRHPLSVNAMTLYLHKVLDKH